MSSKGKIAIYWAAGCGGCEISFLAINEKLLEALEHFDLVFCPCLMDTKARDVEAMAPDEIDVCLFNGGIRTSENEYMAQLLREKSKVMVAYGSCAHEGCIPGLANSITRAQLFDVVYQTDSTENPERIRPQTHTVITTASGEELTLHLPTFYERLRTLKEVVDVDYTLPGCPPEADRIWDALTAIIAGELPPKGAVIGVQTTGADTTVCERCDKTRSEKKIRSFKRTWEVRPDPTVCLLEQGIICCGIATRAGCGALCPKVDSPCIGCYGPSDGTTDFGARMLSALASVIDSDDEAEIERIIEAGIPDPLGTFYRFSLAASTLRGAALQDQETGE